MARNKRIAEMTVRSLEDVTFLINQNVMVFDKRIRKLARNNRSLKIFGLVTLACAVYTAAECRRQDEELYKLSIRVQKLENKEGE